MAVNAKYHRVSLLILKCWSFHHMEKNLIGHCEISWSRVDSSINFTYSQRLGRRTVSAGRGSHQKTPTSPARTPSRPTPGWRKSTTSSQQRTATSCGTCCVWAHWSPSGTCSPLNGVSESRRTKWKHMEQAPRMDRMGISQTTHICNKRERFTYLHLFHLFIIIIYYHEICLTDIGQYVESTAWISQDLPIWTNAETKDVHLCGCRSYTCKRCLTTLGSQAD